MLPVLRTRRVFLLHRDGSAWTTADVGQIQLSPRPPRRPTGASAYPRIPDEGVVGTETYLSASSSVKEWGCLRSGERIVASNSRLTSK